MKEYPKIDYWNKGPIGLDCIAFDKLDGSNIRAEFNRKRGWYKFGTRNRMIDQYDDQFGYSIEVFLNKYSESLADVLLKNKSYRKIESFTVYAEIFGENSFAGRHLDSDKKDIVLFDVWMYKHGFVTPRNFIDDFGHLGIPDVVYKGEYNNDFIESIRKNDFNLSEGVIAKGIFKTKNNKDEVWMCKVKTNDWLKKVKDLHGHKSLELELNNDKSLISLCS